MVFVWIFAPLGLMAEEYGEKDFYFQKQIWINDTETCQAVQIDRDWLLTAAHCVAPFQKRPSCRIRVVIAQGDFAQASTIVSCAEAVLPAPILDRNRQPSLPFDLALIPFSPAEEDCEFHTIEGKKISADAFEDELGKDPILRYQWDKRNTSSFPALYTYRSAKEKLLENVIIVPLWADGEFSSLGASSQIVYIGGKFPSLWSTRGFGVDHGNSGGAVVVVLPNHELGILGIVSAKSVNIMDDEMRQGISQVLPGFEQAKEHFFFYGFADKDSLSFIKSVLRPLAVKKIREVPVNLLEPQPALKKIKAR